MRDDWAVVYLSMEGVHCQERLVHCRAIACLREEALLIVQAQVTAGALAAAAVQIGCEEAPGLPPMGVTISWGGPHLLMPSSIATPHSLIIGRATPAHLPTHAPTHLYKWTTTPTLSPLQNSLHVCTHWCTPVRMTNPATPTCQDDYTHIRVVPGVCEAERHLVICATTRHSAHSTHKACRPQCQKQEC